MQFDKEGNFYKLNDEQKDKVKNAIVNSIKEASLNVLKDSGTHPNPNATKNSSRKNKKKF